MKLCEIESSKDEIRDQLISKGMEKDIAEEKLSLYSNAAASLTKRGDLDTKQVKLFWIPGRIEVAGKHTDYCGGRSLIGAVSKGFSVISVNLESPTCEIHTTFSNGSSKHESLPIRSDLEWEGHEAWVNHPATAIRRLANNFNLKYGAAISICGDIPEAAGMSTSSAIICLMYVVLAERNDLSHSDMWRKNIKNNEMLYEYLGTIENGQSFAELAGNKGVGTFGGSEDHTGIMSSESLRLKQFCYCPTRLEAKYDFPKNLVFVIGVSGVVAEKSGASQQQYNDAVKLANIGLELYCSHKKYKFNTWGHVLASVKEEGNLNPLPTILRDLEYAAHCSYPSNNESVNAETLCKRFEQFYIENEEIVPGIAHAIQKNDYAKLKSLAIASHRLSDTHLGNIVPETQALCDLAYKCGAIAASAFGAGFGGSVWALVQQNQASDWRKTLSLQATKG